jgi:hypothetical protein
MAALVDSASFAIIMPITANEVGQDLADLA